MGSGKSTVGPRLARALGWRFEDIDRAIETREGKAIAPIFREAGEPVFREMEAQAVEDGLREERVVVAPGGGWACREGRLASLAPDVLTIWLRAPAETIWQRTWRSGATRPLLDVERPRERIAELLAIREPYYRQARWWADTADRSADEVVREIVDHLKTEPERPLRA